MVPVVCDRKRGKEAREKKIDKLFCMHLKLEACNAYTQGKLCMFIKHQIEGVQYFTKSFLPNSKNQTVRQYH